MEDAHAPRAAMERRAPVVVVVVEGVEGVECAVEDAVEVRRSWWPRGQPFKWTSRCPEVTPPLSLLHL